MINKEAAGVLVEYSAHIAHYAAIGDVPLAQESVLTRAAGNHAWRLLSALVTFAEVTKESDLYWTLLHIANRDGRSDKECHRLRCLAKGEDRNFMDAKAALAKMLKGIQADEKADPTGAKRQAEEAARDQLRAENKVREEAERKERARLAAKARREAKKVAVAA